MAEREEARQQNPDESSSEDQTAETLLLRFPQNSSTTGVYLMNSDLKSEL